MANLIKWEEQDWYQKMADDCNVIRIEKFYRASMELIEGHYEIGRRIIEDENYTKHSKDGFISKLAVDLKCSETDLYNSINVFKKYPKFDDLLAEFTGKHVTWKLICKSLTSTQGAGPSKKAKRSFQLDAILTAFENWTIDTFPDMENDEIDKYVKEFKKYLLSN